MSQLWVILLGSAAALASMISFVPQGWRIIKTRQTRELSTGMWVISVIGFALWTAYGVVIVQVPLIVENAVCLVLAGFILMMKMLPQHHVHAVADYLDPSIESSGSAGARSDAKRRGEAIDSR